MTKGAQLMNGGARTGTQEVWLHTAQLCENSYFHTCFSSPWGRDSQPVHVSLVYWEEEWDPGDGSHELTNNARGSSRPSCQALRLPSSPSPVSIAREAAQDSLSPGGASVA